MNNSEKVLETMKKAGKPLSIGDIVKISGLEKKEVEKAMNELKKADKIASPVRCYWEPK